MSYAILVTFSVKSFSIGEEGYEVNQFHDFFSRKNKPPLQCTEVEMKLLFKL